jgi:hypothetical protein
VNFSNVSAVNVCYPMLIGGEAGAVRDVTLDNIRMKAFCESRIEAQGSCVVDGLTLRDVEILLCDEHRELTAKRLQQRGKVALHTENVGRICTERFCIRMEESVAPTWDALYSDPNFAAAVK